MKTVGFHQKYSDMKTPAPGFDFETCCAQPSFVLLLEANNLLQHIISRARHIVGLWTFWECFVDLPLVLVAAVTIDWQVTQLWLRHNDGVDKTLWHHIEPMNTGNQLCCPNEPFVVVLEKGFFKYLISPFGVDFKVCNFVDLFMPKHTHYTLTKIKKWKSIIGPL